MAREPADYDRALQRPHDPRYHGARGENGPEARDREEGGPEEEAPDAAPEGPELPPVLHPIPGAVVPRHVLFGVVVFPDDGQLGHVVPGLLEFPHGRLRVRMGVVDRHHRVLSCHGRPPCLPLPRLPGPRPIPGWGPWGLVSHSSAPKHSSFVHLPPSPQAKSREQPALWPPVPRPGPSPPRGARGPARHLLDGPLSAERELAGAGPLLGPDTGLGQHRRKIITPRPV